MDTIKRLDGFGSMRNFMKKQNFIDFDKIVEPMGKNDSTGCLWIIVFWGIMGLFITKLFIA